MLVLKRLLEATSPSPTSSLSSSVCSDSLPASEAPSTSTPPRSKPPEEQHRDHNKNSRYSFPLSSWFASSFNAKRRLLAQFGRHGHGKARLWEAAGCDVSMSGDIYIADTHNHRVQVFTEHGQWRCQFGSDKVLGYPVGVRICRTNSTVLVTDASWRCVKVFSIDATTDATLHHTYIGHVGGSYIFEFPHGLAISHWSNHLVVTDVGRHTVSVFSLACFPQLIVYSLSSDDEDEDAGETCPGFVRSIGGLGSGPSNLDHPYYVSLTSSDLIVVSDSGNESIKIFHLYSGQLVQCFGPDHFKLPIDTPVMLQGVEVYEDQVFVISGDALYVLLPTGRLWQIVSAEDGALSSPRCVAVSSHGWLVVTMVGNYGYGHHRYRHNSLPHLPHQETQKWRSAKIKYSSSTCNSDITIENGEEESKKIQDDRDITSKYAWWEQILQNRNSSAQATYCVSLLLYDVEEMLALRASLKNLQLKKT